MGKLYDELTEPLQAFIREQHMFFVGTAPLSGEGLVNVSPKGLDTLRILGPTAIAYIDLTGSGIETVAHVKENGRMVMMFCSFGPTPLILRLHGRGRVFENTHPEYARLVPHFHDLPGARAIVQLDIQRIADSCGWGVPRYTYEGTRDTYFKFADKIGVEGIRQGQIEANLKSLDGLEGLEGPSV